MLKSLLQVFKIPELKAKILFTLAMIIVCRIGGFIPVPGINGEIAVSFFKNLTGGSQNLFQLVDIFSGGAFSQMTVIALGVVPYISASIMMQLFSVLLPSLQRELRENSAQGKRKLTRWTRLLALGLSFLQSAVLARYALKMNMSYPGIIAGELLDIQAFGIPWLFFVIVIATMTTGTLFLMWVGEQISEKGIGNGMSLIITVGILSQLPSAIGVLISQMNLSTQQAGQMNLVKIFILMTLFVSVIIATIMIIQGHRRIPLQYARRVVGRKEVQGGGASYIPLKVNYAGVIPVIFSSSILMFPATIGQFVGKDSWLGTFAGWIMPGTTVYLCIYVFFILLLTYFWTATTFRPDQIASDMKRNGAFIPGIRQGRPTQEYLETTMHRITFIGAIFLALIAILPNIISRMISIPSTISYFFGGTALLILVGVVLDTMKQIESHLIMQRYDGFMTKGRSKSKY